jgi:hypothetical protein
MWYCANEMEERTDKFGATAANILLTLVYFTALLPFGVATRFFADFLPIRKRPNTWLDYPPSSNKGNDARDQR